jgi:hypothetical protein
LYGLLDGLIVPLAVCSFTKDRSSTSSAWDRGMSFPGSVAGAPGFSSIAWSHGQDGGNSCEASSENTLEYIWYGSGMFELIRVFVGSATILQMYMVSLWVVWVLLIRHGRNHARNASGLLSITGSCPWSIHPRFQSILGWKATNQG